MPPRPLPQSDQNTKTSPGPGFPSRDLAQRPDSAQQSVPTLPSVASLASYGVAAPQVVPASTEGGSPVLFRPLGVHSILNPPAEAELTRPVQRVSQSPSRSISASYAAAHQTPIISPRVRKRKEGTSPGRTSQTSLDARQGRRMLTPKSPSLRSISQGVRGSPSAGSRVTNLPGEGRVYTAEPGDISAGHVPPLPPLALSSHGQYAPIQHHEGQASTGPGSHSTSTGSYSANNQGYVGSPGSSSNLAERENTSPFRPAASESARGASSQAPIVVTDAQGRSSARAYGAGQTAYQMQISTDQGPVAIPVEIDLQQASKSADEKRKRNAGASARFRQRRKEKEQAASAHIADLQRELRSLTEQRDYYRSERNFFRDMIARGSAAQLPPRPPSPQSRPGGNQMGVAPEPLPSVDYGRRDLTEPSPAQRRRTGEYQPSFAPAPLAPTSYPAQYAAAAPPPPPPQNAGYALPPPSLPAPMQDPRNQAPSGFIPAHHPQQAPPPATLRPQPHDPFRRDINPR